MKSVSGADGRTMIVILLLSIMTATFCVKAQEYSGQYDFEPFGNTSELKPIGGLAPLPSGILCADWDTTTPLWQGFSGGSLTTITNNRYSYPIDLGFTFNFYNSRYSMMKASDNYFISFDMTPEDTSSGVNRRIRDSVAPWDAIYLFWDDGRIYSGTTILNQISYSGFGSEVGHRNCILEFYSVSRYNTNEGPNYLTGWIKLYETTNMIELYYFKTQSSTCYPCGSGGSACGLNPDFPTPCETSCPATPTPPSPPTVTGTPTRTPTFTGTATPTRTPTFTPTVTPTPTFTTTVVVGTPTRTRTPTRTPTNTRTATPTPSATRTPTPTNTPPPPPTVIPCVGDDCCDADIGLEYSAGNGNADTLADEPFTLSPYNNDSWHNGCNLPDVIDNCIPNMHYRFKPVSYSFDSGYWPEDFNGLTDLPDWWSLVDEPPRGTGWKYSATGYGAPGGFLDGCVYTDSGSTEEILVTRFVNFAGESFPGFSMEHKFVDASGTNRAQILLSLDGGTWTTLWSMQGTSTTDVETLAFTIPQAANQAYVQVGFKYSRTDVPVTLLSENMSTSTPPAGWTSTGTNNQWQYLTVPMATPINWSRGYGPHEGVEGTGSYFYGTNILTGSSGAYANSSDNYLRSPSFSCVGMNYVEARFFQWLGIERAPNDVAYFDVTTDGGASWSTVWSSSSLPHWLGDTSWLERRFDISAYAANQPSVSLRWRLVTNGSTQSFGWNVDNVSVVGRPINSGYWAIDDVLFQREPTPTPTRTPTFTPSNTPTVTPTMTTTPTPTLTPTDTPTGVPTWTPSPTVTNTPYWTPTNTPTRTPTNTPTNTPTPTAHTPTPTPVAQLNCSSATELLCNEIIYIDPATMGTNLIEYYSCLPTWTMTGNETVFSFLIPETGTYSALINSPGTMVLMSLPTCSEFSTECTAGTFAVPFSGATGEMVYFVVDSLAEFQSEFTIQIRCTTFLPVPATSHKGLIILMVIFGALLAALPFRKR